MKHYEVNFIDRTIELVGSDDLPPLLERFWTVFRIRVDSEGNRTKDGRIRVNLDNVTFIKDA